MKEHFYVYVHSRVDTGEPFYVGKGHDGRAFDLANRNATWHLMAANGFHVSFVARNLDEELSFLLERELIQKCRHSQCALSNKTSGGQGTSGMRHTDDAKRRMSLAHKGVKLSEKHRLNVTIALRGRSKSPETREKLSLKNRGQVMTEAQRAKLSNAKRGKPLSPEHRAAISKASRGKPAPNRRYSRWGRKQKAGQLCLI